MRNKISLSKMGSRNPNWKCGQIILRGRACLLHPDYGGKKVSGKYVYRYRLIMEGHLGRLLKKGELVHHINGIKSDDRLENLQVVTSQEHNLIHKSIVEKWSRKYDACVSCGTIIVHHGAFGRCRKCYQNER